MADPTLIATTGDETTTFAAAGSWIAAHSSALEQLVDSVSLLRASTHRIVIDMARAEQLDTLGAWLLERLARSFRDRGQELVFVGVPDRFRGLLDRVHDINRQNPTPRARVNRVIAGLESVGRATVGFKCAILIK